MPDQPTTYSNSSPPSAYDAFEFRCLETVLNGLDALVYVSDMQTYELLFVSEVRRECMGPPGRQEVL